jgi:hypothetical protein
MTDSYMECIYASSAAGTARNTFTTEAILNDTASMGASAYLPKGFWLPGNLGVGRGLRVVARGIISSTTVAPTFQWNVRLGAAQSITAPIILGSAALTMQVSQTNKQFELEGDVVMTNLGASGGASTVRGTGILASSGLATPFQGDLWGGAASPGTVATVDATIDNYITLGAICGTSNASNAIQLLQLLLFRLN